MVDDISKLSEKAANIISSISNETRIRIVSHYDADGISSAAILCTALYRAGFDFHVSLMRNPFTKGLERVKNEGNELIIFADMGSAQIEFIEQMDCKAIIIDHHQYFKTDTKDNILQINANLCGINGNYEACGSTLCFSIVNALNKNNGDIVALAMAGAVGDKQYIGGIRGYNKKILDQGLKDGFLKEKTGIKLYGDSLFDSLYYSIDPFYTGISGNEKGINELLERLNLDKKAKIEDLSDQQKMQLQSFLLFTLIRNGCQKNILDTVIRKRYWSDFLGCELERFADLLDSCGKGGNRGLGLMVCLKDQNAFNDAVKLEKDYKQNVLNELLKLDGKGVEEKKAIRYFYSKDSSLGGVIGGIASNFILDIEKPLFSIVRNDDEIHVSGRGNQYLVSKGLDLGLALNKAAIELKGHGGGHKIAAGATIDLEKEKDFLTIVDDIIVKQLGG